MAAPSIGFSYINEDAISNDLKCPVCLSPLTDPVVHQDGKCDNSFCAACVVNLSFCPLCRGTENLRQPAARMVKNMLAALRVKCDACGEQMSRDEFVPHAASGCTRPCPNGCGVRCASDAMPAHTANACPRATVACASCGETQPREGMAAHAKVCPGSARVVCPHCAIVFPRAALAQHVASCPRRPEECKSCGTMVPRREMGYHLREICTALHELCPLGCGETVPRREMSAHLRWCCVDDWALCPPDGYADNTKRFGSYTDSAAATSQPLAPCGRPLRSPHDRSRPLDPFAGLCPCHRDMYVAEYRAIREGRIRAEDSTLRFCVNCQVYHMDDPQSDEEHGHPMARTATRPPAANPSDIIARYCRPGCSSVVWRVFQIVCLVLLFAGWLPVMLKVCGILLELIKK